jgi:hypothetical protein
LKTLSDAEFNALSRLVYRDLVLDTLGNLCLVLGLYLVFSSHAATYLTWLLTPTAKALLIATGLLNLRFTLTRFRRLQAWQIARQQRNSH